MTIFLPLQVRDSVTGEIRTDLAGQQIQIIGLTTTDPVVITEAQSGVTVPDSKLPVGSGFSLPAFKTPDGVNFVRGLAADGTMTWLWSPEGMDANSQAAAEAALAAQSAAEAAQAAAEAAIAGGPVYSVNGETGSVTLDAADVGARASNWMPTVNDIDATGTGTPSEMYLRRDGTWAVPPGLGDDEGAVQSVNGQAGAVVLDAAAVGARPSNWTPAVADIPALPASKVGSGTLDAERIPTLDQSKVSGLGDSLALKADADDLSIVATTGDWADLVGKPSLAGSITVLAGDDPVPEDLPEFSFIARYAIPEALTPVVTAAGTTVSTSSGTTTTVTTTSTIAVGDVIVVAVALSVVGSTLGTAAVTLGAGAVSGGWVRASASRASSVEVAMLVGKVTTAIPSGTVVTVTATGNSTNRHLMAVYGITNLDSGSPSATSGDDAAGVSNSTSAGANGSGTSLTASTDASTSVANTLVIAAFGGSGATVATWTAAGGATTLVSLGTAAGSSERSLGLGYRIVSTAGVQSITGNASASGGMAGVVMALPIEMS